MATIDDFAKLEFRIGTVLSAEEVPETDKLIRLSVDLGEGEPRQIISGIKEYIESPEDLIGKQFPFVANLEPRTIKGFESNGMIFAIGKGETFAFLEPSKQIPAGTKLG